MSNDEISAVNRELFKTLRLVREARCEHLTKRKLPPDEPPLCSFCGAGKNNSKVMLAGVAIDGLVSHICDECIEAYHKGIMEKK